MVLGLSGDCSFCGKGTVGVTAVAGVLGRQARICDGCSLFGVEIIAHERDAAEAAAGETPDVVDAGEIHRVQGDLQAALARLRKTSVMTATTPVGELTQEMAAEHTAAARDVATLLNWSSKVAQPLGGFELDCSRRCSFCDAEAEDVAHLFAGVNTKICDRCVRDAANLMVSQLRA
jgi:hypothetical protein